MKFRQLHNRSRELDSVKGKALVGLHLVVWDRIKGLGFNDQIWILNDLLSSIKKRQELHYCRKCRHTDCGCKTKRS